mgnify:CR=1 FL=1
MQQFLELFGEVRVVTVVCVVVAASFVAGVFIKCKKALNAGFKKAGGKAKLTRLFPRWNNTRYGGNSR